MSFLISFVKWSGVAICLALAVYITQGTIRYGQRSFTTDLLVVAFDALLILIAIFIWKLYSRR